MAKSGSGVKVDPVGSGGEPDGVEVGVLGTDVFEADVDVTVDVGVGKAVLIGVADAFGSGHHSSAPASGAARAGRA